MRKIKVKHKSKKCTICKKTKGIKDFRLRKDGYYLSECNSCKSKKVREAQLLRKYNITKSEYDNMVKEQNNKCAICNKKNLNRNLCVDHCHKTGKVRELLCDKCNTSIGKFNDDIELLEKAISYLKKHK